jgi:homoserine O-acetyltransferase
VRSVQRRTVALSLASGCAAEGLALARALAMTTYRTAEEFATRFDAAPVLVADGVRFPVEDYLNHCGRRYAETFSPERFLCLSQSIDLHRIDPTSVRVPATVVAVEGDSIAPPWQVRELAARLGGSVVLREIESRYGHDAFLKEADIVSSILTHALQLENHA